MTTAPAMRRRRRRHWRRGLALAAVAVLAFTTTTYWLADSGTVSLPASVAPTPAGTSSDGTLSSFTALDPSVVVPDRSGSSVGGMALGRVTVAAGYANRLKVDIAWLDPDDAGNVLHNPHAWLGFSLYAPLHTGSCSNESNAATITDSDTTKYCAQQIATSGPYVSSNTLTISKTSLAGYLVEDASDPGTPVACTSGTSSWCAPETVGSNQNAFFVVATTYNGSNAPPGQQSDTGTLSFYMDIQSVT